MGSVEDRITTAFNSGQEFDNSIRDVMHKALRLDELDREQDAGKLAVGMLALEVAIVLANVVVALRRPAEGRTFRIVYDFSVTLNNNPFWTQHVGEFMPLMRVMLMDHLDSITLQLERGDIKISPYDKLIMGAEASPLALFSAIAYLFGGAQTQMLASVELKKQLLPLLMK